MPPISVYLVTMRVALAFLAFTAYAAGTTIQEQLPIVGSSLGLSSLGTSSLVSPSIGLSSLGTSSLVSPSIELSSIGSSSLGSSSVVSPSMGYTESSYTNQPIVVVRKTTYFEPELVAVVVEKGVDDIPEETYLIRNYADVLGASNNEIHLCAADDTNHCLDTPVTKMLVPSLFQSIGKTGFKNFFESAKEVPWVSTINDNVELVKPVISPKTSTFDEKLPQVIPPEVFRYISQSSLVPEYRTSVFPSQSSSILRSEVPVSHNMAQTRYISPKADILPADFDVGFAPLSHITTGGSILGGATTRTYQVNPSHVNSHFVRR